MKKIGILGGMGPQASLHFYEMLIQKSQGKAEIIRNQDYPYIGLENIPVPDLIQGEDNLEVTTKMVNHAAKCLEKAGVNFLVMPCNTMHLFEKEIMQSIHIPFISMIDSVIDIVSISKCRKIGLLGSSTTMQSHLYKAPLGKIGCKVFIPQKSKHTEISLIIQRYISTGTISDSDVGFLDLCCQDLTRRGAEGIILGCTELPLIMKNLSPKYTFFMSSEILAERTLEYCKT